MAYLPIASSSPDFESPERDEMRGNIPVGGNPSDEKQYLYDEFFPDITLLELTSDQTMDNSPLPNTIYTTPFSARTTMSPRIEMNKTNFNQARNLNTSASIPWLENESLPEITNSFNSTVNISTSKIELSHNLHMAPSESNLDCLATLTLGSADKSSTFSPETASPMTRPENEENTLPTLTEKGPTLEIEPTEQASLLLESTSEVKPSDTTPLNLTLSTETKLTDSHHSSFDTKLSSQPNGTPLENTFSVSHQQSSSTLSISQHSSGDSRHHTFDAKPHCKCKKTICCGSHYNTYEAESSRSSETTSETISSHRHHNTFDAVPPYDNIGSVSESCSDSQHKTLEAQSSCQLNGTKLLSKSISNDSHHNTFNYNNTSSPIGTIKPESHLGNCHNNTFDANPPSNNASSISEHSSNNIHHKTIETEPPSGSSGTTMILDTDSSNCLQKTLDTNLPPQLNNLTMSEIKDSFKTNPPTQNNGTITMSDSCSNDSQLNALDTKSNGTMIVSKSCPGDSDHTTSGSKCPKSNGTINMSGSLLTENHHSTFDAKPPQDIGSINKLESQSNEQNNVAAKALQGSIVISESSFGNSHPQTIEEIHPKTNSAIVMSESHSCDPHHSSTDGIITLPESDCHQNNLDAKPSTSIATIPMSDTPSLDSHPKIFDTDLKTSTLQGTLEVDLNQESTSKAVQCEPKDHLQSLVCDESIHTIGKRLVFDDSVDIGQNLMASTPVTLGKMEGFVAKPGQGQLKAALKKFGVAASKTEAEVQAPNAIASNVATKKILFEPVTKASLPNLKATSLLPKFKPTASLPGRSGVAASGVPLMKRNLPIRKPTEGLTVSSSYNLRPSTAASRLPKCGMERLRGRLPLLGGVPPSRSNPPISSTSNEIQSNTPVNSQKRKSELSKDAQSIVKRPKIDVSTSSRPTVSSANGALAKTKSLKFPMPRQGSQLAKAPATQVIPAKRQDEDEAFLLSLLPRMKKIKQEKKHLLRSRFLKALNDAE
ncbi:uncharacterized protein LOC144212056 [Stigmatopora nigra]